MKAISDWLYRITSGRVTLISAAVFILFMIFVLPDQAAKADEYAQGAGSPDTSPFYSPEKLFEFAEAYGEAGREAYVLARFTFDLAFPLVYGGFLALTISWFLKSSMSEENPWRLLNLTPVIGVAFDLLENLSAATAIGLYPNRQEFVALLATIFTPIKWLFVAGSFGVLIFASGIWLVERIRRKTA